MPLLQYDGEHGHARILPTDIAKLFLDVRYHAKILSSQSEALTAVPFSTGKTHA